MSDIPNNRKANHSARLAAVQALYQIDLAGTPFQNIIGEFISHRLDSSSNRTLFEETVKLACMDQEKIDNFIRQSLPKTWTLERIESVLRAILRAACAEFLMDKNLAAAIIINEYVDITRDFYSNREPGFVNGILDNIANTLGLKMKDVSNASIQENVDVHNREDPDQT